MMDYWIFWIDKYTGIYRKGASHAVKDGETKTACGLQTGNGGGAMWDGGYHSADEIKPDCKKCMNVLTKKYLKLTPIIETKNR